MKGGKNMLYFYCCDVLVKGNKITQLSGIVKCKRRINTIEEFEETQKEIRYEYFKGVSKKTSMRLEDISLLFTAFNPL